MARFFYRTPNGSVYDMSSPMHGQDWEPISRAEYTRERLAQCRAHLAKLIKPGDTVYCVLRHVSSSGMQRRISLFVIVDNKPCQIDGWVSDLLGYKHSDKGGIVVNGCGMDMGFHLVYSLASSLHTGERAGYSLKSEWL